MTNREHPFHLLSETDVKKYFRKSNSQLFIAGTTGAGKSVVIMPTLPKTASTEKIHQSVDTQNTKEGAC